MAPLCSRPGAAEESRADHLPQLELVELGEALWERGALALVQCELERRQAEDRALQADGRERDPDLLEQLLLRHRRHVARLPALDHLGQHRGRRLTDRAAAT